MTIEIGLEGLARLPDKGEDLISSASRRSWLSQIRSSLQSTRFSLY